MQQTIIFAISIIFMLLGILYQTMIGVCYQRMIQATDGIMGTNNKLLNQCRERFIQCYQTNGGVSNIKAFAEKYVGRLKFMGMTMHFLKNLSIQFMLAGVFVAGFGVCRGLISGSKLTDLLPFYISSLFGIYLFLSVVSVVDIPTRKQALLVNLTDYLENHVARRLEKGILEKERLENTIPQKKDSSEKKEQQTRLSPDDVQELQELLNSFLV